MSASSTAQLDSWTSSFGREYTDRNNLTLEQMDTEAAGQLGISKTEIYRAFLKNRLPSGRVLEVGCNIGLQVRTLAALNPRLDIHGLEPQSYAVEKARALAPALTFHQGNALDLPFPDASFDLVMTNGVLIHIAPADLPRAMVEIGRVSRRYIFLHEYFAETPTEVRYHGHRGLMWKRDFAAAYEALFPTVKRIEHRTFPYSAAFGGPDLVDQVALLDQQPDGR